MLHCIPIQFNCAYHSKNGLPSGADPNSKLFEYKNLNPFLKALKVFINSINLPSKVFNSMKTWAENKQCHSLFRSWRKSSHENIDSLQALNPFYGNFQISTKIKRHGLRFSPDKEFSLAQYFTSLTRPPESSISFISPVLSLRILAL
jgi:hypothetical protein